MRVLLYFTIGFSCAAGLTTCFLSGGWWLVGVAFGCFPLLATLACRGLARRRLFSISLGLVLGFLWCGCYRSIYADPVEALFTGESASFSATVLEEPSESAYGSSVTMRIHMAKGADVQALVYLNEREPNISAGDEISASGKFRTSALIRGEPSATYASKGIYAIVSSVKELTITGSSLTLPSFLPYRCAAALQDCMRTLFTGDALGIAEALLTGEREDIPDDLYVALQRSGTAHIVSVSGLHVMMLASLLLLIPGGQRRKRLVALPLLWFFALMTGCRPAIIRATVMETLLLLGPALGREYDAPTGLSGALLVLLVQNPNVIANVGLQLSFSSVAGLLLVTPMMNLWLLERLTPLRNRRRLYHVLYGIGTMISASCGAQLFSTPLCALYFGSVSLVGILINLLILPVLGLLFALLLACVLGGLLWAPLGTLLALPCNVLLLYISFICRFAGGLNFSALSMEPIEFVLWLCLVYAVLIAFLAVRRLRKHGPILAAVGAAALLLAIVYHILGISSASVTVQVLDVGQGQCVVAFSGTQTVAVDCGGNSGNAGDHLANVLQGVNREHLDALVLTHYDSDHTGGLEALFSRIEVESLYIPDIADENRDAVLSLAQTAGCTIHLLNQTEVLPLEHGQLTLYAPLETSDDKANNGLSVLITSGEDDFFLSGDLSIEMEEQLLAREGLPDTEYMMAGHHGSKYATGDALLDALTPETVIVSVGYNTYGHPTEEALSRITEHGCRVLRTDLDGSVTIRLGEDGS